MDRLTRRGQILMNNALNRGLVTRAQINAMTDTQIGILDDVEDADVPVMLRRWFNETPAERTIRTVVSVRNTGRKRKSVSKRGKLFMRKSKRR